MSENLTYCACGDSYPKTSYGAGFIVGRGHCENCHAADLAATASHGKEHADNAPEPTWWEIQHKNGRRWATDDKEEAESISQFLTVSPLYCAPIEPKTHAKPVAWHIKNKRFCGDVTMDKEVANYWIANGNSGDVIPLYANPIEDPNPFTLSPVHEDLLPPVGSKVLICLSNLNEWVEHTVTGYYVWPDLNQNLTLQRVFVRVMDKYGCHNARLLKDVKKPNGAPIIKVVSVKVSRTELERAISLASVFDDDDEGFSCIMLLKKLVPIDDSVATITVKIDNIDLIIALAQAFDDGGDGADPESARACVSLLNSWKQRRKR